MVLNVSGVGEFDDESKNAVIVRIRDISLKVLRLDRVIASKAAANREKDRIVMPALRSTWAAIQSRQEKKKRARSRPEKRASALRSRRKPGTRTPRK